MWKGHQTAMMNNWNTTELISNGVLFQPHLKYTLTFFQTCISRSRSFITTLFHSSVHFFPVLVKGLYQTESYSLSTSEVRPILALITPSPLQKKKHCKHIFSQIIQLIVTHLITIMINASPQMSIKQQQQHS
jgi:hypothetical protein